jgi:hypothetical protein
MTDWKDQLKKIRPVVVMVQRENRKQHQIARAFDARTFGVVDAEHIARVEREAIRAMEGDRR